MARNSSRNLQQATDELIDALAQSNPRLRLESNYRQRSVAGRNGLQTVLSNVSDVTRQEKRSSSSRRSSPTAADVNTVGVAPDNEFGTYPAVVTFVCA